MNKINLGIIGYGIQGQKYASFFKDNKEAQYVIKAICDISQSVRKKAEEDFSNVSLFDNYKSLIKSKLVDTVVITGPHYFHTEIANFAILNNVNVICEKPAGISSKEVRIMNELADAHKDVKCAMMLNQRTNKLYVKIKELVTSKVLGEIRRVNWIVNTSYRPDSYYKQSSWRATWGGEGGGIIVNQAPHQIDLLQWICGKPTKMYCKMIYGAHRDIVVENDVTAVMEFENKATGTFIASTCDPLGTDRFEIDFSAGKIVIEDSKKATIYKFIKTEDEINETMSSYEVARYRKGLVNGNNELFEVSYIEKTDNDIQHMNIFNNFYNHVFNNEELVAPLKDGKDSVDMVNAMYLSSWLGCEVTLPVDEQLYIDQLNKRIKEEGKFKEINH